MKATLAMKEEAKKIKKNTRRGTTGEGWGWFEKDSRWWENAEIR